MVYHLEDQNCKCKCIDFQSFDISCCHLFYDKVSKIRHSLFNRRWRQDAKVVECPLKSLNDQSRDIIKLMRYRSLNIEINEICYNALITDAGCVKLKGHITQVKFEMIKLSENFEEKRGRWSTEKRNATIIKVLLTVTMKCVDSVRVNKGVNLEKVWVLQITWIQ